MMILKLRWTIEDEEGKVLALLPPQDIDEEVRKFLIGRFPPKWLVVEGVSPENHGATA